MNSVYYYGQDGCNVSSEIIKLFKLGPREIKYVDQSEKYVFDFVGFIFQGNCILTVFPKHYFLEGEIQKYNVDHPRLYRDIKLLFDVIQYYKKHEKTKAVAKTYLGEFTGYESNYPFKSFFEVYRYYQLYGLYEEKENKVTTGNKGKISWKTTILKSNKIISEGNLIFTPLYVNRKDYNEVFLTECMIFIIDYTIDFFKDFFCMKKTGKNCRFNFESNIDYVLMQLKINYSKNYKDINKNLIQNMIEFFREFKKKSIGGNTHIEIRYFDRIWQQMIESYLNKHFAGINKSTGAAIFNARSHETKIDFVTERFNDIDNSTHQFYIEVDHIAKDDDRLYIFDSKYYTSVTELNYKQIAYNEILRYYFQKLNHMHNILFLPGPEGSKLHFSYSSKCVGTRKYGTNIIEQYLNIKRVMEDYIKA